MSPKNQSEYLPNLDCSVSVTKREFSLEKWLLVLKVASELGFTSIAEVALAKSTAVLDNLQQVKVGRNSSNYNLYIYGMKALCEREEYLSLEEAEGLELKDVVCIAQTREKLSKGDSWEAVEARIYNDFSCTHA